MRLLVIEDSLLDYEMLLATLALQGIDARAERVEDAAGLHAALARERWELVISDHQLPAFSSGEALAIVRAQPAPPPFIIVSGVLGEEAAVEAMRRGADDFLLKGRLARLAVAVRNALAAAQARRDSAEAQERLRASREQLRNLSQRLQTLADEERAAIARELHDEIGGTLTAVRFDLDSLQRHLAPEPLARLHRAQQALVQAGEAARRLMHGLRPPTLDAGLAAALQSQVRAFRERHGLPVDFTCSGAERTLPEPLAMAVYRTCQEALTNIAKHAGPARIGIDLHFGAETVSLEVRDDGRGLEAGALHKPGALGLRGLAERARASGGALDVSSEDGRTTVLLWLPLDAVEPCQ
ncbi:histidine kinase [Ramlibacter sp. MMS24-I3-19]|uniref:hybrid sensor histidine kinase/response regulator n=1 Tax=Ramlibacter sp. MMS24-I3-19 TaxID=3416606 RepID=UPI003D012C73